MKGPVTRGTRAARLLASALLATALVTVAGGTAASGAPAGTSDSTCPFTRTLCLWDGDDFTGTRFTVQALNPSVGTCVDLAAHGWGNGRAKSARNTANQIARLYTSTTCTGTSYWIFPGGAYGSIDFASNSVYVY